MRMVGWARFLVLEVRGIQRRAPSSLALMVALIGVASATALRLAPTAARGAPQQLYSFGNDYFGQLGRQGDFDGDSGSKPTAVRLPGQTGRIIQVAAGGGHSLVVTSTGQLYAFGENSWGQLGSTTNNQTERANPRAPLVTLP